MISDQKQIKGPRYIVLSATKTVTMVVMKPRTYGGTLMRLALVPAIHQHREILYGTDLHIPVKSSAAIIVGVKRASE